MTDPAVIEFRRHMGEAAAGLSESELAQWMTSLQWIAEQAVDHALRVRQHPHLHLLRSA